MSMIREPEKLFIILDNIVRQYTFTSHFNQLISEGSISYLNRKLVVNLLDFLLVKTNLNISSNNY